MQKRILILLLILADNVLAEPWYTGPLLAPSGHIIPKNHTNLETYAFRTKIRGFYNNVGNIVTTPGDYSNLGTLVFSHGLTDRMDMQFSPSYAYNVNDGQNYHHIGETSVLMGYQLLEQKDSKYKPDLRFTVQEIIPTGNYQQLDPMYNGTDATGLGSYQTAYNLNFQYLRRINDINYLRTRMSLGYVNSHNVAINGVSSYGGSINTRGSINLGNQLSADLAGELSITQHWVLVMEAYLARRNPTVFTGFPGTLPDGSLATVGNGLSRQFSLAPAIEYNFNSQVGLIIGHWYTLRGKNATNFSSIVAALNMYW